MATTTTQLKNVRLPLFFLLTLSVGILIGTLIGKYSDGLFSYLPKNSKLLQTKPTAVSETEIKKKTLEDFYKTQLKLISDKNWVGLYKTINPSDKSWYTTQDLKCSSYTESYTREESFSKEYIINSININNSDGIIDVTIVNCINKECAGINRGEKRITKYFQYIDGNWFQKSINEPTDDIRELAAFAWANIGNQKNEFTSKYGCGTQDKLTIIRAMSIEVANNPEKLAQWKTVIEAFKTNSSTKNYSQNIYSSNSERCQQARKEYATCLEKNNEDMEEYTKCLKDKEFWDNRGTHLYPGGCSEPSLSRCSEPSGAICPL